jgi:hypothetical protein
MRFGISKFLRKGALEMAYPESFSANGRCRYLAVLDKGLERRHNCKKADP